MDEIIAAVQEKISLYGLDVLGALIIFIVGRWVAKIVRSILKKVMVKKNVDMTIVSFVGNLAYIGLMTFVIIAALDRIGISSVSFAAVLAAAGLAIGLALQGSLANFAAGFLMVLFRPFKVGDFIDGAGTAGIVEEIHVFTTRLKTPDNKTVIIPNAKLTGDNIINFSAKETRRVDLVAGVSYGDDLKKVRQVLEGIVNGNAQILKDPAPQIAVSELADNSVNFVVRVWVKTADYWDVYFAMTETIKVRFDEEGISIPFPQHDVHMYEHTPTA